MLRIYWVYLKTTLALQFQYRVAMALWMINRIVEPTVFLVVWVTIASARGSVGGYGAADFAAYFIALMVVNQLTFTWIIFEFEWRIRSGEFSSMLLKPIHPIHSDIADNLGYKILTLVILVPAAVLLSVLFKPAFEFRAAALGLAAVSLVIAYFLRMFVDWGFALSAFWTTRTSALNQIYFLVMLFCCCSDGWHRWSCCRTGWSACPGICRSAGSAGLPWSWRSIASVLPRSRPGSGCRCCGWCSAC